MKLLNLLVSIIFLMLLSSCEKRSDYSCTCTVYDQNNNPVSSINTIRTYSSITKEDAETKCNSWEGTEEITGVLVTTRCVLKEVN